MRLRLITAGAVVTLVVACLFSLTWAAQSARAASDDQLPGIPISFGAKTVGSVSATDANDIYSVTLTAGQEVHVRCEPAYTNDAAGRLHLLVPGVQNLANTSAYSETIYQLRGGQAQISLADYDYIPARSGTYYVWVEWEAGTLDYSLTVTRTTRPALSQAAESDDIPGAQGFSLEDASVTGVVSTLTDPNDVYAVTLTTGCQVVFRLTPLQPYYNYDSPKANLYLLAPGAHSLAQRFGHVVWGLVPATNDRDATKRATAEMVFTPDRGGTYYVWVEADRPCTSNFAYRLSVNKRTAAFSDVENSPYKAAIYELADEGIITGFEDGTFRSQEHVSRQQFAKMIVRTLGPNPTGSETSPFTDVQGSMGTDPFYPEKYVAVCAAAGIVEGYPDGLFRPKSDIRRMQLVTMIARAAHLPRPTLPVTIPFAEFEPTHYPWARAAYETGLLSGVVGVGPTYPFTAAATRGECAQMLANLLHTR